MNFLAHIYLADINPKIMIGNFIADSVKGSHYEHFSKDVQFGIKMHRAIDTFTDEHPIFRKSKKVLNPKYRLYKGVIIDLIYDHFLAKNWHQYSNIPLHIFCDSFYKLLKTNYNNLPVGTQNLLPYMTQQNWLYKYRTLQGIGEIMHDMNIRTQGRSKMNEAIDDLKENYNIFENDFTQFFNEIQNHCIQYLKTYDSKNIK